jgi:hypothetical protein
MTTGPGPGFYADTTAPGRERYWNGEQWTEHYRSAAPPPPATFIAPSTPTPAHDSAGALVVVGYIMAVLIPLVGFILGIVAATRPSRATSKHGVWIIVVSVVVFILWLAIVVAGTGSQTSSGSSYPY